MIYALLTAIAAGVIIANIVLYRSRHSRHMTRTGETFEERRSYHERGELSPGEHALAQQIREHLERAKPPMNE